MIDSLSKEIANEYGRISGKSVEPYYINVGIRNIVLLVSFCAISVGVKAITDDSIMIPLIMGTYVGFKPLREVYGGFHFKNSQLACFIATCFIAFVIGLTSVTMDVGRAMHVLSIAATYLLSGMIFLIIGVVDSDVNPLDDEIKAVLKVKGLKRLAMILVVQSILIVVDQQLSIALEIGVLLSAVSVLIAKKR